MTNTITAVRAIPEGEEITITYIADLNSPRARRQDQLKLGYYFTCTCKHCSLPTAELIAQSDANRATIKDFYNFWTPFPMWLFDASKPDDLIINICLEHIALIEREGLEMEAIYNEHHSIIAQAYEVLGDEDNFRAWALKAARVEEIRGDRKEALIWKKKAAGKKDDKMWGMRKSMKGTGFGSNIVQTTKFGNGAFGTIMG